MDTHVHEVAMCLRECVACVSNSTHTPVPMGTHESIASTLLYTYIIDAVY